MEAAGVLFAAGQVVSTTAQAAYATYQISKPTLPLKCHLHRFAAGEVADGATSLARCNHSLTVVHGKAYIFGGEQSPQGKLCSNEMHIISLPNFKHSPGPDYQCIPAIPGKDGESVPPPRKAHKTRANGDKLEIYGGIDESGEAINENERWSFNTNTLRWTLETIPIPPSADIAQASSSSTDETVEAGGYLYSITHTDSFSSTINYRHTDSAEWQSHIIPKNPLSPGPGPRSGAATIPITTGYGRNYLIFLFDASNPDMWALQLHSAASTYSKAKDNIRTETDMKSGLFTWEPVEIVAPEAETGLEGKSLPGPMRDYAADRVVGNELLVWGGVDANGTVCGDGWSIEFE